MTESSRSSPENLASLAEAVPSVPTLDSMGPIPSLPAETLQLPASGTAPGTSGSRFSFLAPPRAPEELGWLGPYRIRGVLGEGGMGVVFDAEDSRLRRRVALKVLKPELRSGVQLRERFLQEARAAAALPQDHVVTIYQVDTENDVPYLAMQYLQGQSLEARLQAERRLPVEETLRIGTEIALGLAVAHEHGLIHRDIKPANIWLEDVGADRPPRVKLLDFGLARVAGTASNLTASGMIVGTPHYMAPEQARGLPLDGRCDLFSLGCVLYRMCTGTLPFQALDVIALLTALAVEDPPPIRERSPDTPPALVELIEQLLAKSREQRPASARETAERLQAIAATSLPSAPARRRVPTAPPRAPGKAASAGPAGPPRRPWRSWAVGAGLGIIGSMLAGVAALHLLVPTPSPNVDCSLQGHPIPVGILEAPPGSLGTTSSPVTEAMLLAIDEINQEGGVLGSRVVPLVEEGTSEDASYAGLANKLILENHVCALFGCCSSAGRRQVRPIIEKYKSVLFYPMPFEALEQSPNIVYLGTTPSQQVLPGLRHAIGTLGKRRLFLVGSEGLFARTAHAIVQDTVGSQEGVRVVGEQLLPAGSSNASEVLRAIGAARPDLIVNTLSGDSNRALFQGLHAAGIKAEKTAVLSFTLGETELRALPAEWMIGHYAVWSYFQSIERPENTAFVHRFRTKFGPQRAVSDPMEAAHVAVRLWANAVKQGNSTEPADVLSAVKGMVLSSPGGGVRIDAQSQHPWKVIRVGKITAGGRLEIVTSTEVPVPPDPFPSSRKLEQWQALLAPLIAPPAGR